MSTIPLDILILAGVAIYIAIKLKGQLGKRDGYDFRSDPKRSTSGVINDNVVTLDKSDVTRTNPTPAVEILPDYIPDGSDLEKQILVMKKKDRNFSYEAFMEGAKFCFEAVLKAFSENDRETLKSLLSKDVYSDFEATLTEENSKERQPNTILVAMHDAFLRDASLTGNIATLTVEFVTDQIYVVRNNDGEIVEGNASQVNKVTDNWVFERDLRSSNPNWKVVTT